MLTEGELDAAMRNPPPDTAAAVRGRYVREFATDPTARASWQCITLGTVPDLRILDLTRHDAGGRAPPDVARPVESTLD